MPADSTLRLVMLFPGLLGTYGDRGNFAVLGHRAARRGIAVEATEIEPGGAVPRDGDIYLLGGGEDEAQFAAAELLRADGGLAAAADRGAVVLAVCAGLQILGHEFIAPGGGRAAGLGLLDAVTDRRLRRRAVGELLAEPVPGFGLPTLTGYENHGGATKLGPAARPLARVISGVGNGGGDGTEGIVCGRVVGTYLHGPALARNPALADLLLSLVVGELPALDGDPWPAALRRERLRAVANQRRARLRPRAATVLARSFRPRRHT
jgi:CobQ-like glutamine amidotransferase family enzyme